MTQFMAPALHPEEEETERSLRPRRLDEFVGQERVKEQLSIALGPGEEVVIYRNFRTYPRKPQAIAGVTAKYVAHCHNLAHEDHSMMFGWQIVDKLNS